MMIISRFMTVETPRVCLLKTRNPEKSANTAKRTFNMIMVKITEAPEDPDMLWIPYIRVNVVRIYAVNDCLPVFHRPVKR